MLPNKEYLRDHRGEWTDIAYKCKILDAVNLNTLWSLYACVYIFQSYWHKYKKQNMSAKQGIHNWSFSIKNKYVCQMHSTYAYSC